MRDDHLVLETRTHDIGDRITWGENLGCELLYFKRDLTRVRTMEAEFTIKLRGRRVERGNRFNDYYGYGSSIMESIEEGLRRVAGYPEMEMKVHAYVREHFEVRGFHRPARVPVKWFDASDRELVETWHNADFAAGDRPESPKFFDWDTPNKITVWDSTKPFGKAVKTLGVVLDELTLRPDGSRLGIPAVRERIERLSLTAVEQTG